MSCNLPGVVRSRSERTSDPLLESGFRATKKSDRALTARGCIFMAVECVESICGMILARKKSKNVGNGSLSVVLARFENISSQNLLPAQTFAKKSTFITWMKKLVIFCVFKRKRLSFLGQKIQKIFFK